MGASDGDKRWQDRFDELAFPSSFILLGGIMVYGKATGWTVPSTMRYGAILDTLYNPIGIVAVFLIGIVWIFYVY